MDRRESDKVMEYIRQGIRGGSLTCGSKLPTERSMAEELKLSRPSVREALRSLENMGLLESRQGSGNYLTDGIGKSLTQSLELMLMMNPNMYEDISQTRRALEVSAFRLAIIHVSEEQLARLHDLLMQMDTEDREKAVHTDRMFHDTIVEASGNHLMIQLMQALAASCESGIALVLSQGDTRVRMELHRLHTQLVDCMEKGDTERGVQTIEAHYDLIDEVTARMQKCAVGTHSAPAE